MSFFFISDPLPLFPGARAFCIRHCDCHGIVLTCNGLAGSPANKTKGKKPKKSTEKKG